MNADLENPRVIKKLSTIIFCYFFIALSCFLLLGFRFPPAEAARGGVSILSGLAAAAGVSRLFPKARPAAIAIGILLQYSLLCLATAMLAFAAATLRFPLQDEAALTIDRFIGYDWSDYAHFLARHPRLSFAYHVAYASILWQPGVICIVLALRHGYRRLVTYQLATWVALALSVAIFAVAPVTTAWVHDGTTFPELRHLGLPGASGGWVRLLIDLRSGGVHAVPWDIDAGIIGFPSFHCAAALLNSWALWRVPWLRMPALLLNAVMIAATPLLGGHYLVDLIAGSLVALIAIRLAEALYLILARPGPHQAVRLAPLTVDGAAAQPAA